MPPLTTADLRARIAAFPRVRLAALPTPIDDCPRLAAAIGVPRLLVKRDDLTGLAFGGNKTRHLEFILGRAVADGATRIVTAASVQSNQCRQTAAAAAKLGLPAHLVLRGTASEPPEANLLLDRLFGAEIEILPPDHSLAMLNARVNAVMEAYRARGERPYFVDLINETSSDNILAALAYAEAIVETVDQVGGLANAPAAIYLCCGSEGSATMAGILVGCRVLGLTTRVIGIPAAKVPDQIRQGTLSIAHRALKELGVTAEITLDDIHIEHAYVGEGYAMPTAGGLEAMRLAARLEGLALEPTYTAKALAALIAHSHEGRFRAGETVWFLHSGGTPLLFQRDVARLIVDDALAAERT